MIWLKESMCMYESCYADCGLAPHAPAGEEVGWDKGLDWRDRPKDIDID